MKIAFPTDEHFPFQDDRAREVAMMVVQDFKPDALVVGSDGLDFYNLSDFDKDPVRVKVNLQKEIDLWKRGQRDWKDAAPDAKKLFIAGNHEDRLRRYLWRHPEIANLEAMQLSSLLCFDELGIEAQGDDYLQAELTFYDKLVIRHGKIVRPKAAMSAHAELELDRFGISIMTGHTHRGGTTYAATREGIVTAQECFCLCRLDPAYVARPNWQQGIVLTTVDADSLSIEPVLIETSRFGKTATWHGAEYRA